MRGRTYRRRKLKNIELTSVNSNDYNIYILSKWMSSKGFRPTKKLRLKNFHESGRGLMAEETIYPGDVIISIPFNLLITPQSVLDSYLGQFFERFHPGATGHEILSVFLMCESSKGHLSEWFPYITSLPHEYSIPIYFCNHSLSLLPKSMYLSAVSQCENVKNSFAQLESLLHELQIAYPAFRNVFDEDLYRWAWSSVNTRCIFMKCIDKKCPGSSCTYHLALAPFLDLLNHSINVEVNAGFNEEKNSYEIISCNKFKKYKQVFISYGCHDNQKLFLEYGFVMLDNHNDYIPFSLEEIILAFEMCNFPSAGIQQKLKYIKDNNLLKNAVCSNDGFSWNLYIVMKILLSEYNVKLWNSFFHNGLDELKDNSQFMKFKKTLINLKIDEYQLNVPDLDCDKCSNYLCLISTLCSIQYSILIKELS